MYLTKIRIRSTQNIAVIIWLLLLFNHQSIGQCKQPIAFTIFDKTTTSVSLSWSDPNFSALGYEFEIIKKGQQRTNLPNLPLVTQTETILTALNPATSYEIYCRTRCTELLKSKWTGPINFNTILTNPTACGVFLPIKDNGTEIFDLHTKDADCGAGWPRLFGQPGALSLYERGSPAALRRGQRGRSRCRFGRVWNALGAPGAV